MVVEIPPSLSFRKLEPGDDLSTFDCGHKDTNDFLKDDALEYQKSNLAVTYVLIERNNRVVGFVSLAMGAIRTKDAPAIIIPDVSIHQYPGLKVAQLGVTLLRQKRGLGKYLILASVKMADELKERVGCRLVHLDAISRKDKLL